MKLFKFKGRIPCAALAAIILLTACSDSGTGSTISGDSGDISSSISESYKEDSTSQENSDTKSDADVPTESTPEATTESTPEATTESTPEATTESTPEATTESTPEATTESTPEATTESTPEATTESTPDTTKGEEMVPDKVPQAIQLEAEDGELHGGLEIISDGKYSGGKAVGIFSNGSDHLDFSFPVYSDGLYDIIVKSEGIGGEKDNLIKLDGKDAGTFHSKTTLSEYTVSGISLKKGIHKIKIVKSWGYINLDYIAVVSAQELSDSYYNVTAGLSNKNSTKRTVSLYNLLKKNYGNNVISGQFCDGGINGTEFKAIFDETGRYPAMLGLDMMDYTPSRADLGAKSSAIERAVEFDKKGGIVTFCWHWNAPTEYLYSTANSSDGWWGGFYTDKSRFDIAKVMNGEDKQGKELIDRDIKAIANQLLRLQDENIPVLWRPLHEGSGGWFWWGAKGADAYKKLWVYLYEQLTDVYGCNNLIWVYNGQNAEFYPGDKYVDIIGEDIYPGEKVYSPQTEVFKRASSYSGDTKIVALTENGCLFDIDTALEINTCWSYFTTWGGQFVWGGQGYNEQYTEKYMLKKVYTHQRVITLDEMEKF